MKVLFGFVLAMAMCMEIVQGLQCFTCDSPAASSECNRETNCTALSPKFALCKTTIMSPEVGYPFKGNETVFRQCAQTCIPTGQNWIGITKRVSCCNIDLCNRSGIDASSGDNCYNGADPIATFSLLTTSVLVFAGITYTAL